MCERAAFLLDRGAAREPTPMREKWLMKNTTRESHTFLLKIIFHVYDYKTSYIIFYSF